MSPWFISCYFSIIRIWFLYLLLLYCQDNISIGTAALSGLEFSIITLSLLGLDFSLVTFTSLLSGRFLYYYFTIIRTSFSIVPFQLSRLDFSIVISLLSVIFSIVTFSIVRIWYLYCNFSIARTWFSIVMSILSGHDYSLSLSHCNDLAQIAGVWTFPHFVLTSTMHVVLFRLILACTAPHSSVVYGVLKV